MSGTWNWDAIYLTCFGVGLVLSVVAFLSGALHLHVGHWHLGGSGGGSGGGTTGRHHAAGAVHAGQHPSPLNGFTLCAFLCWFGGTGYLLHHAGVLIGPLVLLFATLSGLAGAGLIFWFLTRVLLPRERTLEPADTEMTGVIGRLSGAVSAGGFGEMLYSQNGARRSVAVRADMGEAIERGAEVVVMRYARGVAYVRRWDEFAGGLMGDDERPESQEVGGSRS